MEYRKKIHYASYWERLLARLIDVLIYVMIVMTPIMKIVGMTDLSVLLDSLYNLVLILLPFGLLVLLIEVILISKLGGTAGKLLIGLRIQKESGRLLSYKEALIRLTIGRAVSGLFLGLGYFWILKNEKHQGWHDLINDSVVVRKINYGWMVGLLLFVVFLLIDFSIIFSITGKLIEVLPLIESCVR